MALPLAPSDTTNFDPAVLAELDMSDHTSSSKRIAAVTIAMLCLAGVAVPLRVGVRLYKMRKLGLDDYLLVFAAIAQFVFSGLMLYGIQLGIGKHVWDLGSPATILPQVKKILQDLFVLQIFYTTSISLAKLSIMACYRRVFVDLTLSRIMLANGAIVIAFWICSIFVSIFRCNPVSAAWDFQNPDAHCIDTVNYFYVAGAVNGITDLVLCVAPLPLVYQLQITRKEKVIISVLFGLGFFASAATFIRLSHLHELSDTDVSQAVSESLEWTAIELGIGIFCQCVPSFRPLFSKFFPLVIVSTYETRTKTASGTRLSIRNGDDHAFALASHDGPEGDGNEKAPLGYVAEIYADHAK